MYVGTFREFSDAKAAAEAKLREIGEPSLLAPQAGPACIFFWQGGSTQTKLGLFIK